MSGTTLNFHVEGHSIPNLDSDRSKALDHTHWGLSDVERNQHFWLAVSNKMERVKYALRTETYQVSTKYHVMGWNRGVFPNLVLAQTEGSVQYPLKVHTPSAIVSVSNSSSDSPYAGG